MSLFQMKSNLNDVTLSIGIWNKISKILDVFNFRYYMLPWLIVYMFSIIGLAIGAMLIIVFYGIIFSLPGMAALSLIPICSALGLLYWWEFQTSHIQIFKVLLIHNSRGFVFQVDGCKWKVYQSGFVWGHQFCAINRISIFDKVSLITMCRI